MPIMYSKEWLFGRKEAVLETEKIKNNYDKIIVSTKLEQPYMFWLYYSKYDPAQYQKEGGTASGGFLEMGNKFDKYLFKEIDYAKQSQEPKTLFVGPPSDFPSDAPILDKINYLDGTPAIYIVEGQNEK